MLAYQCGCGAKLHYREEHAGLKATCRACGAKFSVPAFVPAVVPALVLAEEPGLPRPRRARIGRRTLAALLGLGVLALGLAWLVDAGAGLSRLGRGGLTEAEAAVKAELLRLADDPAAVEFSEWREVGRPGREIPELAEEPDAAVKVVYRVARPLGGRRRREAIGFVAGGRVVALLHPVAACPSYEFENRRLFPAAGDRTRGRPDALAPARRLLPIPPR